MKKFYFIMAIAISLLVMAQTAESGTLTASPCTEITKHECFSGKIRACVAAGDGTGRAFWYNSEVSCNQQNSGFQSNGQTYLIEDQKTYEFPASSDGKATIDYYLVVVSGGSQTFVKNDLFTENTLLGTIADVNGKLTFQLDLRDQPYPMKSLQYHSYQYTDPNGHLSTGNVVYEKNFFIKTVGSQDPVTTNPPSNSNTNPPTTNNPPASTPSSGGGGCGSPGENPSNSNNNDQIYDERNFRLPSQGAIASNRGGPLGQIATACSIGDTDRIYQLASAQGITIQADDKNKLSYLN